MSTRVVVIGSGLAGLAAAFAARKAKANVTMVLGRPGASALMSGAVDDVEWERAASVAPAKLEAAEVDFLDALGTFRLAEEPAWVATSSGRLRPARGRDSAVLDLAGLEDATVALPRANRPGWDADGLARALSADPLAKARGLRFEAISAEILRFADETKLSHPELAARHDAERVAWLADRLRAAPELAGKRALLFGPWLGLENPAASVLSEALGLPVGETLSQVGGVAGLRFERARDRLLSSLDVVTQPGQVVRLRGEAGRSIVELEGDAMLDADRVVLAIGGTAGGGIVLSKAALHGIEDDARGREPIFTPSLESPAVVASSGRPLSLPSSPYGPVFESLAWSAVRESSLLERVGLFATEDAHAKRHDGEPIDWLLVAGDAIADRPRTVLQALRSGLRAGERAARAH